LHRIEIDRADSDPSDFYLTGKSDLYLSQKPELTSMSSLESNTPNMDFELKGSNGSLIKRRPSKIRLAVTRAVTSFKSLVSRKTKTEKSKSIFHFEGTKTEPKLRKTTSYQW
jgi:hypothetical protein